jgi:DNA-binding XRE family transcriptional regulator
MMWKLIKLCGQDYLVSDDGLLRNADTLRVVKGHTNPNGYRVVTLKDGEKRRVFSMHSLVLEAFVGSRPDGFVANHINGVKVDNRAANLEWITNADNARHARDNNLHHFAKRSELRQKTEEHLKYYRNRDWMLNTKAEAKRLYKAGWLQSDIAYKLVVSKKTLCKWVKEWRENKLTLED